jgi:hypothetical protein
VSAALVQRLLALAGVTLVAVLVALAVTRQDSGSSTGGLPAPAPAPGGGWYRALAAPLPAPGKARRTDCSVLLRAGTIGVSHPVLPCRVQVYVQFAGKRVLTRVVGRGVLRGTQFGVTSALADALGLHGRQQIEWRFAAAPS